MNPIVEICCGSYDDACAAAAGGADRIELNSALWLGGLTPSLGTLQLVKETLSLPVAAMVRPRGGGFCYTAGELRVMERDCALLLEHGAYGIVFGCLREDCTIDAEASGRLAEIIHGLYGEAVFHRAFDCTPDPFAAMDTLLELGIDRVLTSGQQPTAPEGVSLLRQLQRRYGSRIQLLAGSGVNPSNAASLLAETGFSQLHSSCRSWRRDPTTAPGRVSYAYAPPPHEAMYENTDPQLVGQLVSAVRENR